MIGGSFLVLCGLFVPCFAVVEIGNSTVQCGGYIETKGYSSGTITSPGFPSNYQSYTYCIWLIKAEKNMAINLTISTVAAEMNGNNQCVDYLEVREGNMSSPILFSGCSLAGPVSVESPSRWMWIKFYSNNKQEASGFSTSWSVISKTTEEGLGDPYVPCLGYSYRCKNKQCISRSSLCDGFADCGCYDGCDESQCTLPMFDIVQRIYMGVSIGVGVFIIAVFLVAISEIRNPWLPHRKKPLIKEKEKPIDPISGLPIYEIPIQEENSNKVLQVDFMTET